jgi:hypothetical protein
VLVACGFVMALRFTKPGWPYGLSGVVDQGGLLFFFILFGAALIWWGRGLSILYLLGLTLVLYGLAVVLWGPEWGCYPGEVCLFAG